MLQELVASVEDYRFEIEDALDKQLGARPIPFPGMDSKLVCHEYDEFFVPSFFFLICRKQSTPVYIFY